MRTACDESAGAGPDVFDGVRFRAQVIATNLEIPWALAFAADGRLFVTERPGRLRIIENGRLLDAPALTLPDVFTEGEAGLLGVALDPDFAQNRFVYLFYTATRAGRGPVIRIVRFFEANNTLVDAVTILDDIPAQRLHDGGRLRFGPDGYLYATIGDTLNSASAQDLGVLTGKILRDRARRDHAGRQSVRISGLFVRAPQSPGSRLASSERRPLGHRAQPSRERRDQPDRVGRQLRVADDRRGRDDGGDAHTGVVLHAVGRAVGGVVLHRHGVPKLQERPVCGHAPWLASPPGDLFPDGPPVWWRATNGSSKTSSGV